MTDQSAGLFWSAPTSLSKRMVFFISILGYGYGGYEAPIPVC